PVRFGLAEHAGDEVDVDLRKSEAARVAVGLIDLGRTVRAAIQLENPVVEVLDAEAEPGDPHAADRGELALRERARFALERNLLGILPRRDLRHPLHEPLELL